MFTIGQKVTCVDADNQPRLSEGKEYTVYDVTDNGVRVHGNGAGHIPYDYNKSRFEVVSEAVVLAQPVVCESWDEYFLDTYPNFNHTKGVLVIDGTAYKVLVEWDSVDTRFVLSGIKPLA